MSSLQIELCLLFQRIRSWFFITCGNLSVAGQVFTFSISLVRKYMNKGPGLQVPENVAKL